MSSAKQGFQRKMRMTDRKDFLNLFQGSKSYRGRVLWIFWKENELKNPRLGITLKGKYTSVWRMRTKRIVREWFRLNRLNLGLCDYNIVIHQPKEATREWHESISKELKSWILKKS